MYCGGPLPPASLVPKPTCHWHVDTPFGRRHESLRDSKSHTKKLSCGEFRNLIIPLFFVQCNLIFTVIFGFVQSLVQVAVEALEAAVGGDLGDADAQCDVAAVRERRQGFGGFENTLGNADCVLSARSGQDDEEFLTAPAADAVRGTHTAREHFRRADEYLVANLMAELVIDLFEIIQVDHDGTKPVSGAISAVFTGDGAL